MQARQMFFSVAVAFTAMAVDFAAGVNSAPALHKTSNHYLVAAYSGPTRMRHSITSPATT